MQFLKPTLIILTSVCVLLTTSARALAATDASVASYEKANSAYQDEKYDQAARLYQKSLQQGQISEELFYNLGNTYFKQQNYGDAALWYRRALVLTPRMPEPRQNLRTLKKRVGLLDFELKGVDQIISHFRESELIYLFTGGTWIALLCLGALLFIKSFRPWRSLFVIATCLFAALAAASFFGLKTFRNRIAIDHRAVITAPDAIAQTSPVPDAKTVIELPPGSEVRIVTDGGPWQYIDIPGELRGWVRSNAVTPLWPPTLPENLDEVETRSEAVPESSEDPQRPKDSRTQRSGA